MANESRGDQVSIWDLLKELEDKKFRIEDQLTQLIVTMECETRILKAEPCILAVANLLLESWKVGIKPLDLRWFWLETHNFDAGTSHTFFVVDLAKDQIIREEMSLIEGPESSSTFDRASFDADYDSRTSGLAAYWYGRFYQETKLGKFCMLASGWKRPKIFYHANGVRSELRVIRVLLAAILVCLIILVFRG